MTKKRTKHITSTTINLSEIGKYPGHIFKITGTRELVRFVPGKGIQRNLKHNDIISNGPNCGCFMASCTMTNSGYKCDKCGKVTTYEDRFEELRKL